jgi:NADPH:quinone reductase-like Zn-dependent oxidoreductase
MSFEIAASIPAVFCTALYSLVDLAKLCQGESVLIHAATSRARQAAIIVAQSIRAKVFVTVGSEEKRDF